MSEKCYVTKSPEQTMRLGVQIGKHLKGGEIIELVSDLGGGKTTITKGIVEGVGSSDQVSSPTFTISNVYKGGTFEVHHYDFYRLGELGIMSEELQETMNDPQSVSIIEWAGEAKDLFPVERLIRILITPLPDDEEMRSITLNCSDDTFIAGLEKNA